MPFKTLLLATLLGNVAFFQGIIALPANSTRSLIPEITKTFGQSVQAIPTTVVELPATSNSESRIFKRKGDKAWIQFYNNDKCEDPFIGKHFEQTKGKCWNIDVESAAASHMWLHWGTSDFKMLGLIWYREGDCNITTYGSFGDVFQNNRESELGHGVCVKFPESIRSFIGIYPDKDQDQDQQTGFDDI